MATQGFVCRLWPAVALTQPFHECCGQSLQLPAATVATCCQVFLPVSQNALLARQVLMPGVALAPQCRCMVAELMPGVLLAPQRRCMVAGTCGTSHLQDRNSRLSIDQNRGPCPSNGVHPVWRPCLLPRLHAVQCPQREFRFHGSHQKKTCHLRPHEREQLPARWNPWLPQRWVCPCLGPEQLGATVSAVLAGALAVATAGVAWMVPQPYGTTRTQA
mmetsp:Transcript_81427/g.161641  ORF Transcript_81427/g.161641 Transcript_81427/m.161641 type:complete len:217 (+) Transcript_81427:788-1438(+)